MALRYCEVLPKCEIWSDRYWVFHRKNDGFWSLWGILEEYIKQNIINIIIIIIIYLFI